MGKTPTASSESYLREFSGFRLNSLNMREELNNMVAYLENKKMNAMTCDVTSRPALTAEANYVYHPLDILDQPDEN